MTQSDNIKDYCSRLKLSYIYQRLNSIILKAQENQPAYIDFLEDILRMESEMREAHTREVRVKMSRIPQNMILTSTTSALSRACPKGI